MKVHAPSLLDKLLASDASGHAPAREGVSMRFSVEQVKDSVARDIEMLLNSHASVQPEHVQAFPQASRSVVTLGLVDISSLSMASVHDQRRIKDAIREAVMTHDRRLTQVEVNVKAAEGSTSKLIFSIRAKLILRPTSEPVVFDAVLQPGSKRYEVSRSDGRSFSAA